MAYPLVRTKGLDILYESLVVIFVVSIGAFVMLGYYFVLTNKAKEVLLKAELTNIRTAVSLFTGFEEKYPESLKELIDTDMPLRVGKKKFTNRYLVYQRLNEEDFPVDPFGNIYVYNPDTGAVKPSTSKYSSW